MFDDLLSEIADAPGEIYDIPEMKEFDDDFDNKSFDNFLDSENDF